MEFSRALGAPIDSLPCPECRIVPDDAQDIVNSMHVDGGAHAGTVLEDTIVVADNDDIQEIPDGQPHEDDVRILRMSEIPCPFGLNSPEFYENHVHPSAEALAVIAEGAALDEQEESEEEDKESEEEDEESEEEDKEEDAELNDAGDESNVRFLDAGDESNVRFLDSLHGEDKEEEDEDLDEESDPPSEIRAAFSAAEIRAARNAADDPDSDNVPVVNLVPGSDLLQRGGAGGGGKGGGKDGANLVPVRRLVRLRQHRPAKATSKAAGPAEATSKATGPAKATSKAAGPAKATAKAKGKAKSKAAGGGGKGGGKGGGDAPAATTAKAAAAPNASAQAAGEPTSETAGPPHAAKAAATFWDHPIPAAAAAAAAKATGAPEATSKAAAAAKAPTKATGAPKATSKAAAQAAATTAATAATAAIDEPPATDAALAVDPRYSPVTVQCDMCGNQAVPLVTARIMSKRKGTWKCAKCNSSLSKVYRSETTEATAGLLLMPEEQKNEFWLKVHTCCSAEEIRNTVATYSIVKENKQERFFHNDGKFLPLAVWSRKGFDADRISNLSTDNDRRVDRVLGMTYRVEIMCTGNRGSQSSTATETLQVTQTPKAAKSSTDEVKRLAGELERMKKKQKLESNACKSFADDIKKCGTQITACKDMLMQHADVYGQAVHTQSNNLFGKFEVLRGKLASDAAAKDAPPT